MAATLFTEIFRAGIYGKRKLEPDVGDNKEYLSVVCNISLRQPENGISSVYS